MLELGKYSDLNVVRKTQNGIYLSDTSGNEVLLPYKFTQHEMSVGSNIRVFIYKDSEDRIVATTQIPKLQLHEFGMLKVETVNEVGAFLDWGLDKNLLVPFREQAMKMEEGRSYLIFVYLDEQTQRLAATAKLNRCLDNSELTVNVDDEVDLIMWKRSELGVKVIVNQRHEGLIFNNEFFATFKTGETLKGYVKAISEDNKLDIRIQNYGFSNIEPNAQKILERLNAEGGFLPLTDKSEPEDISARLEMSKKTFKKAIGTLYKQKQIRIEEDGIYLNESQN